jgi:hypothetical protein
VLDRLKEKQWPDPDVLDTIERFVATVIVLSREFPNRLRCVCAWEPWTHPPGVHDVCRLSSLLHTDVIDRSSWAQYRRDILSGPAAPVLYY